ncbi:MAG TPA: rhodanese-like domain-containing protein [Pyrinomonadaceae bacterium]|nr:rhodanese-like domain-containing protein [Pyrinomonadaceae bacterium]
MRLVYTVAAAVVLAALTLAACNSTEKQGNSVSANSTKVPFPTSTAQHVAPSDGVKRVTTVELRDGLDKGEAIVIDVRPATSYQQAHVKGAINIPLEQVESRLGELPRDKMIVTYCS